MVSKNTHITAAELDSTKLFHPELMKGKVCLITGGSNGGLLKQTAQAYLQHGAKAVAIFSRNSEKHIAVAKELSQYGTCIAIQGNVRQPEACVACVDQVLKEFGQINVLVNGAAGNFLASAEKLSVNGFKTVIETDAMGALNMCQAVFKGYMKKHGGVIINVSATLHWTGSVFQIHAAAAKASVDAITKVLAAEWGPRGVRVNGLVPGAMGDSEGAQKLADLGSLRKKTADAGNSKKALDIWAQAIPSQRLCMDQDAANAALYLSSNASHYVNGANIVVDGGNYLTIPFFTFAQPDFIGRWSNPKL